MVGNTVVEPMARWGRKTATGHMDDNPHFKTARRRVRSEAGCSMRFIHRQPAAFSGVLRDRSWVRSIVQYRAPNT
jgi:hypothetical protein